MPTFTIESVFLKGKSKTFPMKWKKEGKSAVSVIQNAYSAVRRHHNGDKKGQYVLTLKNGDKLSRYHCKCIKYTKKELSALKKQFKDRPVPKYKIECKYLKKSKKKKMKKQSGGSRMLKKHFENVKYQHRLRMRLLRDKISYGIITEDIPNKSIETVMRVALKMLDGVLNEKLFKTKQGHRILHELVQLSGLDEVIGDIMSFQRGGSGGRENQLVGYKRAKTTKKDLDDLNEINKLSLVGKTHIYNIQKEERLHQKTSELEQKVYEEFKRATAENKKLFRELLEAQQLKCKDTERELWLNDMADNVGTCAVMSPILYTIHGSSILLNNVLEGAVGVLNFIGVLFAHIKNMLPIANYYIGSSVCPEGMDKWIEQKSGEIEEGWLQTMGLIAASEKTECVGLDTTFLFGGGVSKMMVGILMLMTVLGFCFTHRAIRIARGRTNFTDERGFLSDIGFKLTAALQVFFVRESKKIKDQRKFVRKTKGQQTLHYDAEGTEFAIGIDERRFVMRGVKSDNLATFFRERLNETHERLKDQEKETRSITQQLLLGDKKNQ